MQVIQTSNRFLTQIQKLLMLTKIILYGSFWRCIKSNTNITQQEYQKKLIDSETLDNIKTKTYTIPQLMQWLIVQWIICHLTIWMKIILPFILRNDKNHHYMMDIKSISRPSMDAPNVVGMNIDYYSFCLTSVYPVSNWKI